MKFGCVLALLKLHARIYHEDSEAACAAYLSEDATKPLVKEFLDVYDAGLLGPHAGGFHVASDVFTRGVARSRTRECNVPKLADTVVTACGCNLPDILALALLRALLRGPAAFDESPAGRGIEVSRLAEEIRAEFTLFIDFLYVNKITDVRGGSFPQWVITRIILEGLLNLCDAGALQLVEIADIRSTAITDTEPRETLKLIALANPGQPRAYRPSFRVAHYEPSAKIREEIILIGFFHYTNNSRIVAEKLFKDPSVLSSSFVGTLALLSLTAYWIDRAMVGVIKKHLTDLGIFSSSAARALLVARRAAFRDSPQVGAAATAARKELETLAAAYLFYEFCELYASSDKALYFIPYADFRGRIYYDSPVSPQGGWMFRFLYNFGEGKMIPESGTLRISAELQEKMRAAGVSSFFEHHGWVFLSLGFKFIAKGRRRVAINDIIAEGISRYQEFSETYYTLYATMSRKDATESIYYITLLTLLKKGRVVKRYLVKDTTGSIYRQLGRLLLFRDKDATDAVNLTGGAFWYDTYAPILEWARGRLDEDLIPFFSRASLKPLLITIKYGIGFRSALSDFLGAVAPATSGLLLERVTAAFAEIFTELTKNEADVKLFYKTSLRDFTEKAQQLDHVSFDDITVSLTYRKSSRRFVRGLVGGRWYTLEGRIDAGFADENRKTRALLANITQAGDSDFLRRVLRRLGKTGVRALPVHDALGVPFDRTGDLIDAARRCARVHERLGFITGANRPTFVNAISVLM